MIGNVASNLKKNYLTRFSGTGNVNFGNDSLYNFERTDPFSVYVWARWSSASVQHIIARVGNAAANTGWSLLTTAATPIRFSFKSAVGNRLTVETTATGWNNSAWHSVINTYDGSSDAAGCNMYVDGNSEALTTVENTLSASTQGGFDLDAGRDIVQGAFQFTGDMGGLAIFSGVISSGDRAVLHNGGRPPIASEVLGLSNLLGFWMMGNGATFPTIPDLEGANDGTMVDLLSSALRLYGPPY